MKSSRHERGSLMVMALVVIVALAGIGLAFLSTTYQNYEFSRLAMESDRAFQVAESGLQAAFAEVRVGADGSNDGIGMVAGRLGGGEVTVSIEPEFEGPGRYLLRSVGTYGSQSRGIETLIRAGTPEASMALFAERGITGGGSIFTDSYDSALGSYSNQAVNVHAATGETYALDGGDLASNQDIYLQGGTVHGDARPGSGGSLLLDGNAAVTGSTAPRSEEASFEAPEYLPPIASQGTYSLPASGWDLWGSGTYRFTDLVVQGNLAVVGEVVIYVDSTLVLEGKGMIALAPGAKVEIRHGGLKTGEGLGRIPAGDVSVSGQGVVNTSQRPSNFRFYSSASRNATIRWGGGVDVHGVLRAPLARFVPAGRGEFFGSVICGEAVLEGQGAFHFDLALEREELENGFAVHMFREFRP